MADDRKLVMKRGTGSIVEATCHAGRGHVRSSPPVSEIVIENGQVNGVASGEGFMPADRAICATTVHVMDGVPERICRETCTPSRFRQRPRAF